LQLGELPREIEQLSDSQKLNEYIMTALRTHEGINLKLIEEHSGIMQRNQVKDAGKKWQQNECMQIRNEQMILTKKGKLFADGIASDLFVE
jgi:oxygen-independent coproporphyrinogen-3 oxidase